MSPAHRRYLAVQALIGGAINAVLSLAFCLLLFGGQARVGIAGAHGLIADAAPQSFMVALMSVLVPTLVTRTRKRRGRIAPIAGAGMRAPRHPLLRAAAAALGVAVVAVLLHALLLPLGPPDWPLRTVVIAKVAYGALLGAALSLAAVRLELGDAAPERQRVR